MMEKVNEQAVVEELKKFLEKHLWKFFELEVPGSYIEIIKGGDYIEPVSSADEPSSEEPGDAQGYLKGSLTIQQYSNLIYKVIVNENLDYDPPDPKNPKRGHYSFQVDMLIKYNFLPLVVIEVKANGIDTHNIILYSTKARMHKNVYPYLRYGLVVVGEKEIPRKFFVLNEAIDFIFVFEDFDEVKNMENSLTGELFLDTIGMEILNALDLLNIFRGLGYIRGIKVFQSILRFIPIPQLQYQTSGGIPKNITRAHVLKALQEIDKKGIPPSRMSRDYVLVHNGKFYPPKYVISLANKYANGYELPPDKFSGGAQTNNFLKKLGFTVINIKSLKTSGGSSSTSSSGGSSKGCGCGHGSGNP